MSTPAETGRGDLHRPALYADELHIAAFCLIPFSGLGDECFYLFNLLIPIVPRAVRIPHFKGFP